MLRQGDKQQRPRNIMGNTNDKENCIVYHVIRKLSGIPDFTNGPFSRLITGMIFTFSTRTPVHNCYDAMM